MQAEPRVTLGGTFRRYLPVYAKGTLVLFLFQLAMNRIDWAAKSAIDRTLGAPGNPKTAVLAIFLLAVCAFVARVLSRYYLFNAGRDVEYDMRKILLSRLHRLGTSFYRTMGAGEIMTRATSDLQQVRLLFGFGVLNLVNVLFAFASGFQVMWGMSWKLTLASLSTTPILVLMTRFLSRGLFLRTRENQEALGALSDLVQRNLSGLRVVRSFALEERERASFDAVNGAYIEKSLALSKLRGSLGPLVGATSALSMVIFFWYGGSLLYLGPGRGGISAGSFYAFWMAFVRMTWPMMALGFSLSVIQRGRAGFSRLSEIFEREPEVVSGDGPEPKTVRGALLVKGLSFSHGDKPILRDVSLHLAEGESLAIVGRTGAGKSTLAMLLCRLLPTARGTVFLDGVDVCDLPLSFVRRELGYAQQDAFLFSTSVRENIGFSDAVVDDDRIQSIARSVSVAREVEALPDGYDTMVGERGVQLSGGQKQRVALARALLREPAILILDDPLSAVDAETEAVILSTLRAHKKGRTVLLITHRIVAAQTCDRILVLEGGRVVAEGTHDQLVLTSPIYRAFADEQTRQKDLEAFADLSREAS